jgi:hypothetical protein
VTLSEALDAMGELVVYTPYGGGRPEIGQITGVQGRWVFVLYVGDLTSKATMPQDIRLYQEMTG